VLSLSKPWADLENYRRDRLKEALYEAELAEEFLKTALFETPPARRFKQSRPIWRPWPRRREIR
jgi:hypothetical protein